MYRNSEQDPAKSMYETLINLGVSDEKLASENANDAVGALRESDLTDEQLEILAAELDNHAKDADGEGQPLLDGDGEDNIKKDAGEENTSFLEKLASTMSEDENPNLGVDVLVKFASALEDIANEEGIDLNDEENRNAFAKMAAEAIADTIAESVDDGEGEEGVDDGEGEEGAEDGEGEEGAEDGEEIGEEDIEALAAEYDEAYEKLASDGYTIADYAYTQTENEKIAEFVGEQAEKLAAVSGLNPLLVADDLLAEIDEQIS